MHATHTGGCGFCSGLGTTLRGGISTCWPLKPVNGSSIMQRIDTSSASSHMLRLSAGSMPNPPSSPTDDDSPVPNSTRPLEMRSSVDTRSATRAGWLTAGGRCMIPNPSRMSLVRWLAADRKISGAVE